MQMNLAEGILQIPSVRKTRLFLSACCRHFFCDPHGGDSDSEMQVLEPIEWYADGLLDESDRAAAHDFAMRLDAGSFYALDKRKALMELTSILISPERVWENLVEFTETQGYQPLELPTIASQFLRDVMASSPQSLVAEPSWRTPEIISLAQMIYGDRVFNRIPELGQLLDQAGCNNAEVLHHCRQSEPHVRGCWVVDLVLGKS